MAARPGALAAVFFVHVLQHLLAPLVLEVDVDVRRFVPLAAHEPLEQQIARGRVDRGDAQAKAHGRVGRRAAALAQDVSRAGESHQVPHGEKIRFVAQVADQLQFVLELLADFFRHAGRVALGRALPGELRQILQRRLARGRKLGRIFVAQLLEREPAAVGDLDGPRDRIRRGGEQRADFVHRPQVPLGVGKQQRAFRGGDRRAMADRREHIMQHHPRGHVVMHIARRHERDARLTRQSAAAPRAAPDHRPRSAAQRVSSSGRQKFRDKQELGLRLGSGS